LLVLSKRNQNGTAESVWYTPLDLVIIGKAVPGAIRTLARKRTARALTTGGARELTAKELRGLTTEELTRVTAGRPEPFLSDGLAHIFGKGPRDRSLALATEYMTSAKFQVHFNAVERLLLDLERNLPANLKEVTLSYNRIPLQFRQSITRDLQEHIEIVCFESEVSN
jgi:hypothetical protein